MQAPKKRGREKLTPWFDGSVKPPQPGVYQRMTEVGPLYAMWDGSSWLRGRSHARAAAGPNAKSSRQTDFRWRGRAERP